MSISKGLAAEQVARKYLLSHGLLWLESNYRCRFGEIDLIMQEGEYLVFVEVRARASHCYGGSLASVTIEKQRKIIKTATYYLTNQKKCITEAIRFDVLGFDGKNSELQWIKNAFS